MDEMQLLRELGDETPLASARDLAPARATFVAATTKRPRRRFALYGAAVVGLAAAIVAVFALMPGTTTGRNDGGPVPQAKADAVQVLKLAAATALAGPDAAPRADQFLYLKTTSKQGELREDWISVDGTHDGLLGDTPVAGCRNGRAAVIKGDKPIPGMTEKCEPSPAYLPNLPTDVNEMVKYLTRGGKSSLNSTGKDMMSMLWMNYMRPQSRAAIFEAASRIDGLTVEENGKDVAGRPGIKIAWNDGKGYLGAFVVDAKTYAYLGDDWIALLTTAIVDKVGQRP
jgi:hypothetical protein